MQKVILLTGATDGIGFETAKMLLNQGHHVIIHGRSESKVNDVLKQLESLGDVDSVLADLSRLDDVRAMATSIKSRFSKIDVLINNAGVFKAPSDKTVDGLDIRFAVNTVAPYLLTQELLPLLGTGSRVVNLSSAAQARVSIDALKGKGTLSDGEAYAQSKLAITMWSTVLGKQHQHTGPMIVSVNPKSLLGSKMVKSAYGIAGSDLSVGAEILVKASLSSEFEQASGLYYDNDIEAFSAPHSDALNEARSNEVIEAIESLI